MLVDKAGPDGAGEFSVIESGAILMYLADKYDSELFPKCPRQRSTVTQWVMWQMDSAPYLGQFGHFYRYAKEKIAYAIDRYTMETKRLCDVLDKQLGRTNVYVRGDSYTIADIAIYPWIACLSVYYNADKVLGLNSYEHVQRWMKKVGERDAVKRGIAVLSFGAEEKHYSTTGEV